MSSDLLDFAFGSGDQQIGRKAKSFKGKKDEIYRLSFAYWHSLDGDPPVIDGHPRFMGIQTFYFPGVGYVKATPEIERHVGKEPKYRVGTIVVSWPLTRSGKVDTEAFKNGEYEVLPWYFGEAKYEELRELDGEDPFAEFDLRIKCTDTSFQKMVFKAGKKAGESLLREMQKRGGPRWDDLLARIREVADGLGKDLCKRMDLDRVLELQQESADRNAGGDGNAAATPTSASSQNVDSLVDAFLGD